MKPPTVLLILDGWGMGPKNSGNATTLAKLPNLNKYWSNYPHTQLFASGVSVGLPEGEDGNTETGHLNIGAGTVVYQDLPRINMAIDNKIFEKNSTFLAAANHVKKNNSVLHLMGLIGEGGVHSNIEHLYALLSFCKKESIKKVYIHGFTDGRDSPRTSGINYIQNLIKYCKKEGVGEIATIMGRYYAMDRDKRWDRIEKAYNALTIGEGIKSQDPVQSIKEQYDKKITDEFIEPIIVSNKDGSPRVIKDGDAVIFFNYRIDRPRELTRAFVLPNFEEGTEKEDFDPYAIKYEKTHIQKAVRGATFKRKKILKNLFFATMTRYEENLPVNIAFPPQFVKDPIGKVFSQNGLSQLRITETEKEKFVTYYLNGQEDIIFPHEDRVIIPSKGTKSYDETPEMSAREIAREMILRIKENKYDVIICNFANADMVAHTGNLNATIKACETLDDVIGQIVNEVLIRDGTVIITADHGNAEELINNETKAVDTEHSTYPVPFIVINNKFKNNPVMLSVGVLADVAPTILHIMNIEKPASMTGRALI